MEDLVRVRVPVVEACAVVVTWETLNVDNDRLTVQNYELNLPLVALRALYLIDQAIDGSEYSMRHANPECFEKCLYCLHSAVRG